MAKKVRTVIKLQIEAGKATPAPPVGTALGPHGVNIMGFVKEYNERTSSQAGNIVPVALTIYEDRSFSFELKTPPAGALLKQAAGIEKGSSEPHAEKVGTVPASKVKRAIADVLQSEGFIASYAEEQDGSRSYLRLRLNYVSDQQAAIGGIRRVSRPGLRVYVNKREIPRVYGGLGVAIMSTSSGVMTGQEAWRRNVGGEVLCYVW